MRLEACGPQHERGPPSSFETRAQSAVCGSPAFARALRMRADLESYGRLKRPLIQLQITVHISAKPEIGFAAGVGEGMIDGDD